MSINENNYPFESYGYKVSSFKGDEDNYVIRVPEFEFWAITGETFLQAIENGRTFYHDWVAMMIDQEKMINQPKTISPFATLFKLNNERVMAIGIPISSLNYLVNVAYEALLIFGQSLVDVSLLSGQYETDAIEHSVWIETTADVNATVEMNLHLAEKIAEMEIIPEHLTLIFRPFQGDVNV